MRERRTVNIPYLDGWRGLAIIAVLVCHFGPRPAVSWVGTYGVQMFFALSGYLMGQLLFVKRVPLPEFFFRRASRILPVFLLFIGAMYLYARFFQASPYGVPAEELLATVSFLRTYYPNDSSIWEAAWPVGNVWSLNVEEHSYVFLALLAMFARKLRSDRAASALLIGAVLASAAIYFCYWSSPPAGQPHWELRSECAAMGLLFSAMLCQIRQFYEPGVSHRAWAGLVVLLIGSSVFLISAYRIRGGSVVFAPILLAIALNYLHCIPEQAKAVLSNPVLVWFGKCSFSLYLWQQPFFIAAHKGHLSVVYGLPLALLVAALSFYYIEDPMRIQLNRFWGRRKSRREPFHHESQPTDAPRTIVR